MQLRLFEVTSTGGSGRPQDFSTEEEPERCCPFEPLEFEGFEKRCFVCNTRAKKRSTLIPCRRNS